MRHILVDASVLACPNIDNLSDEVQYEAAEKYINRLIKLSTLKRDFQFVDFWRDGMLPDLLAEEDSYPFRHSLKKLLDSLPENDFFQLEDANRIAMSILEKSRILEECGEVLDVSTSEHSINPPFENGYSLGFENNFFRSLALALPILGCGKKLGSNVIIARKTDAPIKSKTSFKIDIIDRGDGLIEEKDEYFEFDIFSYENKLDLVRSCDVHDLWLSGSSFEDCVCIFLCQIKNEAIEKYDFFKGMVEIGDDFHISLKKFGFKSDRKKAMRLIRSCSDILMGLNLDQSHHLRENKGPNSHQRFFGDWKAWRHDLDDEFHLHYWKNGNSIKLSNVVTHNNFSITF